MEPKRILFDWLGCIVREYNLYEEILRKSNNHTGCFENSDDWENIRTAGTHNHFDTISPNFFNMGNLYPEALEVVNEFSEGYKTQSHIIYDQKPKIQLDQVEKIFSFSLNQRGFRANSGIVSADKLKISKTLGANILVDDDPRVAVSMAYANIPTVLMLRKWNMKFDLDILGLTTSKEKANKIKSNIYIAEDWVEAKDIIDFLLEKAS